jgi:hypothetical protein
MASESVADAWHADHTPSGFTQNVPSFMNVTGRVELPWSVIQSKFATQVASRAFEQTTLQLLSAATLHGSPAS